jgi:tetratricopeptide (TPR) repeat protein
MKEGLREYLCTVTMGLLISVSNFATATGAESTFKECCGKCHVRPASVVRGVDGWGPRRGAVMRIGIAFIAFFLILSPGPLAAQSVSCGDLPPVAELGITKEQQLDNLLRRAIACVRARKFDLAIDIFSEMISLDPGNETAYVNRANAYIQSGQVPQGIADLSNVISLKPTFAEAWYNRGIGFLAEHKYERAIADFSETLRLKPDFARAYCNRGLALVRKQAYDRALDDLDIGLEKNPKLPLCHFARGDTYFHKGDYQKAVDDYTSGLKHVQNIEALSRRAEAYERLGEKEKALADFKVVLENAPTHKDALEGVARLSDTRE